MFEPATAPEILRNVLPARPPSAAPSAAAAIAIEFDNGRSTEHGCYSRFSGGHLMGTRETSGEHLMPDAGLIMSSGESLIRPRGSAKGA